MEATISWDVSGYYMYLPAFFIYKDLKALAFKDEIIRKYQPSTDFQQAYQHPHTGNYVMKYPIGHALIYTPFFLLAHLWASLSSVYSADGFSMPYQFMISFGSLFYCFLGLYFLRKFLLFYFEDKVVGIVLALLVFGTNYLNYTAIDGAMTHNMLFTIYAVVLYLIKKFYDKPDYYTAAIIGALIGAAALTRPTEVLISILPFIFGVQLSSYSSVKERFLVLKLHWKKIFLAVVITAIYGMIQLGYWKYVAGEWLVYSYQDQGFSWLKPHLVEGLFNYKGGWLIYTPVMIFALLGFVPLCNKDRKLFDSVFVYSLIFIYMTFAWDIWWYGGSLGQRALIQLYPVLSVAMAAMVAWVYNRRILVKLVFLTLVVLMCMHNLLLTHQAHRGGILYTDQMTKAYFWKIFFRIESSSDNLKLLDTDEFLDEDRIKESYLIFHESMETLDTIQIGFHPEDTDNPRLILDRERQFSPVFSLNPPDRDFDWLRVKINIRLTQKEWEVWKMTQFIVKLKEGESTIKEKMIRLQRHLNDGEEKQVWLDIKKPKERFDKVEIYFWHADSQYMIYLDDLTVVGVKVKK